MRRQYLRILMVLIGVAGLGLAAKGQDTDHVDVKIPHQFVVAGQTLPAGTYRVTRPDLNTRALAFNDFADHASVIVLASQVEISFADKFKVSFEQVGGQLFLSKIQTGDHLFTIPVSRAEILEAAAKSHSTPATGAAGSASGAN
jgi:hypothetical protein